MQASRSQGCRGTFANRIRFAEFRSIATKWYNVMPILFQASTLPQEHNMKYTQILAVI